MRIRRAKGSVRGPTARTGDRSAGDQRGRPLRIVYVLGTLDVGGTEIQTVRLAREMSKRGHHVSVIVIASGGVLGAALEEARIPYRLLGFEGFQFRDRRGRFRPWVVLANVPKMVRLYAALRHARADVCHAQLFWSYSLALPLAWLARVPIRVNGRRGRPPEEPSGAARVVLDTLSNRSTTCYLTNAEILADEQSAAERTLRTKWVVIPNGLDLPDQIAEQRGPVRAVMLANLIPYKGHEDLLRALRIMERPLDTTLIGDGLERSRLEAMATELGLGGVVHFEGTIPEARRLLPYFQIGVLASHQEGLPNAVLECMAAGLAVVATAVGGVPELIQDGDTGLLVPPHDPRSLADALDRLIVDAGLRARVAARARRAAGAYAWDRCVERHLLAYRGHSAAPLGQQSDLD